MSNEESIPTEYPYAWSPSSSLSIDEFTAKYKPSMVQNDGTKPWLWVLARDPPKQTANEEAALEEARELLGDITQKVEAIKNDNSIPVRSNKKTGARSKKEVREDLQAEATKQLKEISVKHGYTGGKWLNFAGAEQVDSVWSRLATSLVSGPLSSTAAFRAKVSTSPQNSGNPNYQYVMCVYVPNVYDEEAVRDVMRVLLRNHGLKLSGVKSDLYTLIGLDSKHASGIPSTVWKATGGAGGLLKDAEIKELRDAFFAGTNEKQEGKEEEEKPSKKPIAGKAKATAPEDDPFASDDEEEAPAPKKKAPVKKAPVKKAPLKKRKQSDTESDDEGTDPKKKQKA